MNISLIGYGNVSYNLAHSFHQSGHSIISIHGRNLKKVKRLSSLYKAEACSLEKDIPFNTEIVILCIKDDHINSVSKQLTLSNPKSIVCHTSGSVGIGDIALNTNRKGVFYPLQTIRKESLIDFKDVPICINGLSSEIINTLSNLAKSISKKLFLLTDLERRKAHLAAVIVNNFTNHIISEAFEYLESEQIPIELVQPLLKETVNKLLQSPPDTTQTGPAKRNDNETINSHIRLLKQNDLAKLYKIISTSITNKHCNK